MQLVATDMKHTLSMEGILGHLAEIDLCLTNLARKVEKNISADHSIVKGEKKTNQAPLNTESVQYLSQLFIHT